MNTILSLYLILLKRQASVEGTMITLMKCEEDGVTCRNVEVGGTKAMDLLMPNKWNYVDVLLENEEVWRGRLRLRRVTRVYALTMHV